MSFTFNYTVDVIKCQNDKVVCFKCTYNPFTSDNAEITGPCSKVVIPHMSQRVEGLIPSFPERGTSEAASGSPVSSSGLLVVA